MQSRDPRESGEYWKKHVTSWEAGAYYRDAGSQPRLWDGLSALFRGNGMYVRMEAALRLAAPHVQGMSVLDIGCASGRFAIQLLEAGAERVIGLDVAPAAIEAANRRRSQSPYADRLEFRVADLAEPGLELPQVDLLTALGVIEYFDAPALDHLLSKFRTRYFLLDFPDIEGRSAGLDHLEPAPSLSARTSLPRSLLVFPGGVPANGREPRLPGCAVRAALDL